MLDLSCLRKTFAEHMAANADQRFSMDAALMHTAKQAFLAGAVEAEPALAEALDVLSRFVAVQALSRTPTTRRAEFDAAMDSAFAVLDAWAAANRALLL